MKYLLLLYFLGSFLFINLAQEKKRVVKQSESSKYIYSLDEIYNYLFFIGFYHNEHDYRDSKNYSLFEASFDTSYNIGIPLKDNYYSKVVDEYLKNIGKYWDIPNNSVLDTARMYVSKIIPIDSIYSHAILPSYRGWELSTYLHCRLKRVEENYIIVAFYRDLDVTGLGGFSFEEPYIISNDEYYFIGNEQGEAHQNIAVHYFPKSMQNKTHILMKCKPLDVGIGTDEKIEYEYNFKNETIRLLKYHKEVMRDSDTDWFLLEEKNFNLGKVVDSLRVAS